MGVLRQTFGKLVAPIALSTVMAASVAIPAFANDDDAPVTSASVMSVAPVEKATFTEFDDREKSTRFAEAGASNASHNKLAILVRDGNDDTAYMAYEAALELQEKGFSVAIIWGPSKFPNEPSDSSYRTTTYIDIYAGGGVSWDGSYGKYASSDMKSDIVKNGEKAFRAMFPNSYQEAQLRLP